MRHLVGTVAILAAGSVEAAELAAPGIELAACTARLERARLEGTKWFDPLRRAKVELVTLPASERSQAETFLQLRAEDRRGQWALVRILSNEDLPAKDWFFSVHPHQPWLHREALLNAAMAALVYGMNRAEGKPMRSDLPRGRGSRVDVWGLTEQRRESLFSLLFRAAEDCTEALQ